MTEEPPGLILMDMSNADRTTYIADFGNGQVFERRAPRRSRPFTHAAMSPKRTAGPRSATFHRSEEDARAFATKAGKVVAVAVKN